MTSRERVHRCIEFGHPDRVPRDLWMLPVACLKHDRESLDSIYRRWPLDFDSPGVPNPALAGLCEGDAYAIGTYRDEWGCEFENIQAGVIGEVKHPLIDDWSKLESLRPPVESLTIDIDSVNHACNASDKFMFADCWPRPFERVQFLRGSENTYLDLGEGSAELLELLSRIHEHYCRELEVWSRTRVDALRFMDDWGSQRAMLISPTQWRRLFKPLYADYVRIAHDSGKKIFMHSDGHIFDIYEDLVEIGIDAINSQLFCMDIEQIGRQFKGRITFWGEIDRQHIMPAADPGIAQRAARRVIDALYDPTGGVIAQFEFGAAARIANAHAVFEAWEAAPFS